MHIPEMGGRLFPLELQAITGQPRCTWAPTRFRNESRGLVDNPSGVLRHGGILDFGNPRAFSALVRKHRAVLRRQPCALSYEAGWRTIDRAYGPDLPLVIVALLMEPHSWTISALQHDWKVQGWRAGGVSFTAMVERLASWGCLQVAVPTHNCSFGGRTVLSPLPYAYNNPLSEPNGGNHFLRTPDDEKLPQQMSENVARDVGRLKMMVFGLVEYCALRAFTTRVYRLLTAACLRA
jgi:hypothetical protein